MIDVADIGIVGAGQLARMTIQAAIPLDISIRLLAASPEDGAALVASDVMLGSPDAPASLRALAGSCRVMTFDHELVPVDTLAELQAEGHCLRPSPAVMAVSQDKRLQREAFARLGLPLPPFTIAGSAAAASSFAAPYRFRVAVKAARGGYDGRGVWLVENESNLTKLVQSLLDRQIAPVIESRVPIEREVAIIVARRPGGEMTVYPLVETVQRNGMLQELIAPAPVPTALHDQAAAIARTICQELDIVGLLAVEFFVTEGTLLVNEIATRPHNSGHYTIEGSVTSQFEQHLRAILDLPLGAPDLTAHSVVTVNIVGGDLEFDPLTSKARALSVPGAHLHLYGKAWRPGRKLGHVTVCGDSLDSVRQRAWEAAGHFMKG